VREAVRELEKRGLAVVQPRRGAFVGRIDNDAIADIFNIRAVNLGLAARYAATMASDEALAEIDDRISALERLAEEAEVEPVEFALASGRAGAAIGRAAGSAVLKTLLVAFAEGMFWSLIWRAHRIDFLTRERRREVAVQWRHVMSLLRAGDGPGAEGALRDLLHENRDKAFERFGLPGSPPPDPRRMIRAGREQPA
jgi:DNA-binding GntR family transcriptional regulator